MADTGGQKIFVITCVAQQEHAHIVNKVRVRAQVEIEITAHPAAGKHAHRASETGGCMASILERFPGHFQKLTVLGVKDRSFLGIDMVKLVQRGSKRHIIRPRQHMPRLARGQQLLFRNLADRPHPIPQIAPIGLHIARTGKMRGHADDGDVILCAHVRWPPFFAISQKTRNRHPDGV
jgi:hypothetical protein